MNNNDLITIVQLTVITILITIIANLILKNTFINSILLILPILLAGYSLKVAFYIQKHNRNILSLFITTGFFVVFAVIYLKTVGITYLPYILSLLVLVCVTIAYIKRKRFNEPELNEPESRPLVCENCGQRYRLKDNVETCWCGGDLFYESPDEPIKTGNTEPPEIEDETEEILNVKNAELLNTEPKTEILKPIQAKILGINKIKTEPVQPESRYVTCEKCGQRYRLDEDESITDFESCWCGGDLFYESLDEPIKTGNIEPPKAENENEEMPNVENTGLINTLHEKQRKTEDTKPPKVEDRNEGVSNVKNIEPKTENLKPIQSKISETLKNKTETSLGDLTKQLEKDKPSGKKYRPYDLIFTFIFTALCLAFLLVPPINHTSIGKTLGIILIILLPGYAITSAVFPIKKDMSWAERLGLSLMLSLLLTLFMALILNYRGSESNITPLFITMCMCTLAAAATASFVLLKTKKEERYNLEIAEYWRQFKGSVWNGGNRKGKLSVILIILLVVSVVTTIYLVANPNPGESFTEFYLLGPNGKATDYPTNITAGKNANVIIGMVNHEHEDTSYRMLITSNGTTMTEKNITLQENQKLEIPYNFSSSKTGKKEIEFKLYKQPNNNDVYLSLHLWVTVK